MKLQLDASIIGSAIIRPGASGAPGNAAPGSTGVEKPPAALAETGDGARISVSSAALNQSSADRSEKIDQLTRAVQGGFYQTSSAATSNAVVEDTLSGG
jgi:hypothetical protein